MCEVACRAAGGGRPERDRGTDGEPRAAGQRRDGVSGGYNVGLHRAFGVVGWIAGGHDALVERALGAVAVVAADAENDGALFVHWIVAAWARATVVRRQRAGHGVGAADRPLVWLPFDDRSDETVGDRRVASVRASAKAREQAILEIGHNPRAAAGAGAPDGAVAIVDSFHVPAACIGIAGLGVAVVEAAITVVVGSIEDRVHALRPVSCNYATGSVVTVAGAG